MGLYVEIIAIGPFSEALAPYFQGAPEQFAGIRPSAIVNLTLFGIAEGTSLGKEFASYFGVTDVYDLNQHRIVNEKTDVEAIKTFVSIYSDYDEEAEVLFALLKHGFEFHLSLNA